MMKYFLISVISLCVCSATAAQSAHHRALDDAAASFRALRLAPPPNAPGVTGGLVPNANECAPGLAEPSWGGRNALLGYICGNGGN